MLGRRKNFSSIIHRTNAIVHFGGVGSKHIEYWRPREDGKFDILKSDYRLTDWFQVPIAFVIDKDDY